MLIGVLSDTHDNTGAMRKAVALFNARGVTRVFHAGDFTSPSSLAPLDALTGAFTGIFGNNDRDQPLLTERSRNRIHRQPYRCWCGGKRIIVMHEPGRIRDLAAGGRYDIIVYGHTHKPVVTYENNVLIVNPGEAGGEGSGRATVGIIDTARNTADIILL